jgi:hypothetical protein
MFPGGKGSRCVGLTTLSPSCADCPLGLSRPVMGLVFFITLVPTSTLLQNLQITAECTVLVITTVSEDPAVISTIQNPESTKLP